MGGGSETTTSTGTNLPPEYTIPGWQNYLGNSEALSQMPFQQSPFPTMAPVNDYQNTAWQMQYDRALNGSPESNAGRAALTGIAAGNQANPWQSMLMGTAGGQSQNPFLAGFQGFNAGTNPFMAGAQGMAAGETNPNMIDPQAFIDATSKDMTSAAQKGVMAQTDAAANRAGAYGGSAYSQMQADNSNALADSIGQMSSGARLSAAGHNANLWQQGQQNRLSALGIGNQAFLGGQGLNLQALQGGGSLWDSGLGRQLQAAGMGGQMFNQDVGNMLSAAGMAPAYGQMDQNDFAAMLGAGNQMQGYQQGLLNAGNQSFQQQLMYPFMMNDYYGNALTRASGNYGQRSQSQTEPGADPFASAMGTGLALLSIF